MPRYSEEVKEQARQLRRQGLSYRTIGNALGIPADAANRWCNPDVAERSRQKSKVWRAENPEVNRAIKQTHYYANVEAERARSRAWHNANREKVAANALAWQRRNKHKTRANSSNRRAVLTNATPPWQTAVHRQAIEDLHALTLALEKASGVPHHLDHIFPLTGFGRNAEGRRVQVSCGLHVPWNLRPIPAKKNCSKWAWHPDNEEATAW